MHGEWINLGTILTGDITISLSKGMIDSNGVELTVNCFSTTYNAVDLMFEYQGNEGTWLVDAVISSENFVDRNKIFGVLSSEFGSSTSFTWNFPKNYSAYGQTAQVRISLLSNGESFIFDVPLIRENVGISNIRITDGSGNQFSVASIPTQVKVSFDVDYGEQNIKRIKYSLWTKNYLNHLKYFDYNGTSRSYIFSPSLIYSSSVNDVIYVQIDVEDKFGVVNTFRAEQMVPDLVPQTGISRMAVAQRKDGSGLVDICYHYCGSSIMDVSQVAASVSTDGSTWSYISSSAIRGDVGAGILPGRNCATWNPMITYSSSYPSSVYVKINLTDADEIETTSSGITVLSLYAPTVDIRKLSIDELESSSSS